MLRKHKKYSKPKRPFDKERILEEAQIKKRYGLKKEDILKRRLQSVLVKKKLVTTQKSARQLITHKKVLVNNKIVNAPSYMVPVEFEDKISLKLSKAKKEHLERN